MQGAKRQECSRDFFNEETVFKRLGIWSIFVHNRYKFNLESYPISSMDKLGVELLAVMYGELSKRAFMALLAQHSDIDDGLYYKGTAVQRDSQVRWSTQLNAGDFIDKVQRPNAIGMH